VKEHKRFKDNFRHVVFFFELLNVLFVIFEKPLQKKSNFYSKPFKITKESLKNHSKIVDIQ